MSDLINRSKLLSKFNHDDMQTDGNDFVHLNIARRCIEDAPTVDAVEVVRCKECKHCGFCGAETNLEVMGFYGYCSRGERKEGKA